MSHFEIDHFDNMSLEKIGHFENGSLRRMYYFEIDDFENDWLRNGTLEKWVTSGICHFGKWITSNRSFREKVTLKIWSPWKWVTSENQSLRNQSVREWVTPVIGHFWNKKYFENKVISKNWSIWNRSLRKRITSKMSPLKKSVTSKLITSKNYLIETQIVPFS